MIEQTIKDLDLELQEVYANYSKLHEELVPYRGRELKETDVKEVNRILEAIQDNYKLMFPALNFILLRHQFCINVMNEYQKFIHDLQKAGATEVKNKNESKLEQAN